MRVWVSLRDGETTTKIKFALLMGGGGIGAERKIVPKHIFFCFVGNAMTITFFESANFIVKIFGCHCAGS